MPRLRMRDFMTVKVMGSPKLIFNDAAGADSLYVTVAATHSGVVNGNMRFYRPDCMQATTHLWLPVTDGMAPKPVLLRHDRECDPVGRVMKARYVDLSYKYSDPQLRQTIFYDGRKGRKGLFESVDWVVKNLSGKDGYEGLGYIELGLKITDPATIGKVQRDEYMTVSVGFDTDQAICSVCHTDWAHDDRCEHRLGRMYDGKRCYLITGNHTWEEVSWVTFPADPYASVISKKAAVDALADSLATRAFYLGLPQKERDLLVMADSLEDREFVLESDIEPIGEDEMDLTAIAKEIKGDGLTKERALELIKELEAFTSEDASEKRKAKRTLTTLNATVKNNGWDAEAETPVLTKDAVEAKIAGLDEATKAMSPEEKEAYIAQLADEAAAFGLDFKPAAEPEAPAAPENTDGQAETQTPATDAQAGTGAVELPEILKGLSAEDSKKLTDSKNGSKILKAVQDLDALFGSLGDEGDEKYLLRSCMSTLQEKWSAEGYLAYLKSRLETKDETVVSKSELDTLHDAIEKYEADSKKRTADTKALLETNKALIGERKKDLATVIVALEVLSGNKTYQGLDVNQLQAEIERRSKRHLISLQDAVSDLMDRLPAFKQTASEKNPTEVAKEVSDNAQVTDQQKPDAPAPAEGTSNSDAAPEANGTEEFPVVTLKDLSRVRKSRAVAQYRQLKDKKTE